MSTGRRHKRAASVLFSGLRRHLGGFVDADWTTCSLVVRLSMFWVIWPAVCVDIADYAKAIMQMRSWM